MQVLIVKKIKKDGYSNITKIRMFKKKGIMYYWNILKYKLGRYEVEELDDKK